MDTIGKVIAAVIVGVIVLVALFLLVALVIQWLVNIVLAQYSVELLSYQSALAITALITAITGGARAGGRDN